MDWKQQAEFFGENACIAWPSTSIALDELFLPPNMGAPDITIPVGNVTYQD